MNKKFLLASYIVAGILAFIYLLFLIVPSFINLDKFKPEIQKIVSDSAKLKLDYSKLKIYTTPFLSAGVIIEDLNIALPDNSNLIKSPKIKAGIKLPSLLTLTVKTSKSYIDNPQINLEIINNEQYKLLRIVEDIINETNSKPKTETPQPKIVQELTKRIRIVVPSIKITNYEANVVDLKTKHYLSLKGEKLYVGYNSARNFVKLQTNAKLYSDENKNIDANINIISALPKPQPKDTDIDPEEKMSIPFVNPVTIYQNYDLKTNINSKLRIHNSPFRGFLAYGFLNIDNLSLKLSDIRLPESYFHSKFKGKTIEYDSNIFAKEDEKIALDGAISFLKRPRMKLHVLTDEIHFENLLNLFKALLDSLNIKNDLSSIQAKGYLVADTIIKTNFKKLKSQGSILVKEGSFVNQKTNIGIKDIIVNLILDKNVLDIKETHAIINGSKLSAKGVIDNKSVADIKIDIDNLSLPELYNAFAPKEIKQAFKLNSAKISANIDIKGKLDKLNAILNTKLDNLAVSDAKKTMFITNKQTNIIFEATPKFIKGDINNNGFLLNIPQMKTKAMINNLNVSLDDKDILIKPFDFTYNDLSKITINGDVKNYLKSPLINIFADGSIQTENIKQTLGKEISYFLSSKGNIPLKVSINGDAKKQDILAQIYADSNNYITPININSLVGKPSLIQADIKMQNGKIKIKNSGLYRKENIGFNNDLNVNILNAHQLLDFTTIIDKNHINLLRIEIPNELSGSIDKFKKSSFKTKGKMTMNGYFDKLFFGGDLKVYDLNIPEILFSTKMIDLDFFNQRLNVGLKEINLNQSKIDASLKADLAPAKVFKISDIDVTSNFIDVDKAMVVLTKLMEYMPPASPSPAKSSETADIPLAANGKFDIKKIKTGAIEIFDTKGNLAILKNDLLINKLSTKAFKGAVNGDIKMNLLTSLLTIKLQGKNLDSNEALEKAANMKDVITGELDFKTDISLKGSTYQEQMKSLKGSVWFDMKDGQYGPFAKLENFFLAENIRENPIFANTIGVILTPITTIDSTHYENLNGKVDFKDGTVYLSPITSQGDILCILIKGNMNLLTNKLDSNVRVRLASTVSDMLGPISMLNPVNLIKNTPGLNVGTAKMFSMFTQTVQESEYKEIPDFAKEHSDANATKFQIVLNGDVAKPLSLVKSFKWLALQEDIDKAQKFSDNYVKQALIDELQSKYEADNKLKVGVEKILQMDTTAPEVKQVLVDEVLKAKEQTKQNIKDTIQAQKEAAQAKQEVAKQELQQKVQETIEAKQKENQQKLNDLQQQLKDKIKTKIPPIQPVDKSNEISTEESIIE